jgi:inner membrane protein
VGRGSEVLHASHLTSGTAAAAWLAVAAETPVPVSLAGIAVGGLAALSPDLDHPGAKGVRFLGPVGSGLCQLIRWVSRLTTGVSHRGLTHSLVWAVGIGCLTGSLTGLILSPENALYLGVSACLGVVAALLGDLVTLAGLSHLLWPFDSRVSIPRPLRIKTGGLVEALVVLPLVSAATALGVAAIFGVSLGMVSHV